MEGILSFGQFATACLSHREWVNLDKSPYFEGTDGWRKFLDEKYV